MATTIYGTQGPDTIIGTNFQDLIYGLGGNDTIHALGGNDTLNGGTGSDSLEGGEGDDIYYVDSFSDVVVEYSNQGTDTVVTTVSYDLPDNFENLTLQGSAAIFGIGNNLNNFIRGNWASNTLSGLGGNDTLFGLGGNDILHGGTGNDWLYGGVNNDTYYVDSFSDVVVEYSNQGTDFVYTTVSYELPDNVENLTLQEGTAAINGTGNNLNNVIIGNSANNTLFGLGGNDRLYGLGGNDNLYGGTGNVRLEGGEGDDTYYVNNPPDVVVEYFNQGTDTLVTAFNYTLLDNNFENLTLQEGTAAINGTGNNLNNVITGNSASNRLSGLGGNDTLFGWGGNDTLDGGTGNDWLYGGEGDDIYYVDSSSDVVVEYSNQGTDFVYTTVSYNLPNDVEFLILQGSAAINGTGNNLNNFIVGNSASNTLSGLGGNDTLFGWGGNDILDGGTGNDWLYGGVNNDTYYVDSSSDVVVEYFNQGRDTVVTTFNYTLPDNVENLTLQEGTAAINGTGNNLGNLITGNSANNTLSGLGGNDTLFGLGGNDILHGGTGNDWLYGGEGDDIYYVDSSPDAVVEYSNQGTDTVVTTVSYNLPNDVEDLILEEGTAAVVGTGNTLPNLIIGNSANNTLFGLGGDDTLFGLGGDDTLYGGDGYDLLIGGAGNDTYFIGGGGAMIIESSEMVELSNQGIDNDEFDFNSITEGVDRIANFNVFDDTIQMSASVFNLPQGFVDPSRFVIGTGATDSTQRFIYNNNTGGLFFDEDGNGSQDAVQIANLPTSLNLTSNNIFLL